MITINSLKNIIGSWKGVGIAEFPTIKTFEYNEELNFAINEKNPALHFEQKAWIRSADSRNNEPISWESGFIIDKGNNLFELVCIHNTGRLEWYRGFTEQLENEQIKIEFSSVAILNDDRMISSKRSYLFSPTSITYAQSMSTTKVMGNMTHLTARLERSH